MPQLVPAIYVFAGSSRTSVKPKFLNLLGSDAARVAIIEFRENASQTLVRGELYRLIAEWWPRCAEILPCLPVRIVVDSYLADSLVQSLLSAACQSDNTRSVPLSLQLFDAGVSTGELDQWQGVIGRARTSGRFVAAHGFLLYPQFKEINLRARTSPVLAFLVSLFALTQWREEAGANWFQTTWTTGCGVWATAVQSVVASSFRSRAEHLVDAAIWSNLCPTFSPLVQKEIRAACNNELPLDRLVSAPVNAANTAAKRQYYLNERLNALLLRAGEVSVSLEQVRAQIEALSTQADPVIREALEDLAIEITRVVANPPDVQPSPSPTSRHILEAIFTIPDQDLAEAVQSSVDPIFAVCPIPVPLYFEDITAVRLRSKLLELRQNAIAEVANRIEERFRQVALTQHYAWLGPSLNPRRLSTVLSLALGCRYTDAVVRRFTHMPDTLERDFTEEVTRMPETIGFTQFLALGV